jgi:hypothetical protein
MFYIWIFYLASGTVVIPTLCFGKIFVFCELVSAYCLLLLSYCLTYSSALKMHVIRSSDTSSFLQKTLLLPGISQTFLFSLNVAPCYSTALKHILNKLYIINYTLFHDSFYQSQPLNVHLNLCSLLN